MSDFETLEDTTPLAHCTIAYLGPVAPHWEIRGHFGDTKMLDDFWTRVTARLLLLPRHDPQFRRNKERVNRDAERERITVDWDLGDEESSRSDRRSPSSRSKSPARATAPVAAPVVEEAVVEETVVEEAVAVETVVEEAVAVETVAEEAVAEEVAVEAAPDVESSENSDS